MKFILLLLFICFSNCIKGQIFPTSSSVVKNLIVMTQSQIDSIQAFEGVAVINSSSNCLNYFVNGNWFELCGNCIPELVLPKIDSIVQRSNELFVFYTANSINELSIRINNLNFVYPESSPVALKIPVNTDDVQIHISVKGPCGQKDSLITKKVQPVIVGKTETLVIENKRVLTRKINNVRWLCEDYKSPSFKSILPKYPTLTNPFVNKNICPVGWELPSKNDWINLLAVYSIKGEVFDKPTDNNNSIGLIRMGIYSIAEKKFYGEDAAYYWSNGKQEGKQELVSITAEGSLFMFENAQKALTQVRCICYE
jgi:uncharacterized protein (TIGR02145 family)